ncbi:MAG: tRNA-dihydrouridine synthase, partial [Rhizobiales bacterium]|nr:tRNA-dihydrouridine synthase [Hyphomicrobiales bacterium]
GEGVGVHVVQLAGREAYWMTEGAKIAAGNGADILDINMGCPSKKVTNGYSGSALMRNPDHALELIKATVTATTLPVCLKMRLGWDENSLNAPEIALRAEEAGIQLITIHGRTRSQFYKGKADWKAIKQVCDAVSIPVIANGDLVDLADVRPMLEQSGAKGLMIGRGAYGKPWFPGYIANKLFPDSQQNEIPGFAQKLDLILEHYEGILEHYGLRVGLRAARKHLGWYLQDAGISNREGLQKIMSSHEPEDVRKNIKQLFSEHQHLALEGVA